MPRTVLFLLLTVLVGLLSGCGTITGTGSGFRNSALEIPPDLTAPNTTNATRVPTVTESPVSAQTIKEFEAFQSKQQQAEYQEFLVWRDAHNVTTDTSIAAFREAKRTQREAKLLRDGVLVANDDFGREVLLIYDTLDNSWNRIDTALINLNLQLLNSHKSTYSFRISYEVGREGGTDSGWRNWATLLTGRAIYQLQLVEDKNIVVASIADRNGHPVISPIADTFIRRLAAQLRTFAGKQEQFITGGVKPLVGLSLNRRDNGQLQLVIPENPEEAWKRLTKALRDANFSIASQDRDLLSISIRYSELGKKPSRNLLTRLGLQKEKDSGAIKRYQIRLMQNKGYDATAVTVWNAKDEPADIGEQTLSLLFEKLKN